MRLTLKDFYGIDGMFYIVNEQYGEWLEQNEAQSRIDEMNREAGYEDEGPEYDSAGFTIADRLG